VWCISDFDTSFSTALTSIIFATADSTTTVFRTLIMILGVVTRSSMASRVGTRKWAGRHFGSDFLGTIKSSSSGS
jgi:hypothetical protein